MVAAFHNGILGQPGLQLEVDLGEGVVPPPDVEEEFSEDALGLREPPHVAGVVGPLPHLLRGRDRLVVPVQVAQHDGLVDL